MVSVLRLHCGDFIPVFDVTLRKAVFLLYFAEFKRPIFIWNISNNDLMKIIDELSGMNQQIFIAIEEDCLSDYPSLKK